MIHHTALPKDTARNTLDNAPIVKMIHLINVTQSIVSFPARLNQPYVSNIPYAMAKPDRTPAATDMLLSLLDISIEYETLKSV